MKVLADRNVFNLVQLALIERARCLSASRPLSASLSLWPLRPIQCTLFSLFLPGTWWPFNCPRTILSRSINLSSLIYPNFRCHLFAMAGSSLSLPLSFSLLIHCRLNFHRRQRQLAVVREDCLAYPHCLHIVFGAMQSWPLIGARGQQQQDKLELPVACSCWPGHRTGHWRDRLHSFTCSQSPLCLPCVSLERAWVHRWHMCCRRQR